MITQKLNELYESYGYKRFKMSKFEPYELYTENKDFLNTGQIITFTDLDGELLALKPDVTLSIMKSGLGIGRIYYNENIYRPKERHYIETEQSGIEYIGALTTYAEAEVIALAVKSLKIFGKDIRIRISDVALFSEIFENLKLAEHVKPFVLKLFETKNSAGLNILVKDKIIDVSTAERLKKFLNIYLPFEEGVKLLGSDEFVKILSNENKAAKHLKELITGLKAFKVIDKVYLDFSMINSMDYYNGIIFQGAVSDIPFTILSGGRYDKLAEKMGKETGAIGFALDLSLVLNYKEEVSRYDADYLIIYDEDGNELIKAVEKVEELTAKGKKVYLIEKTEEEAKRRIRAKEIINLDDLK